MKTRKKVLCISSLVVAAVLSALLSFLGIFSLAWTGLPTNSQDAPVLGLFVPLVLAFPLFALSVAVTKYAPLVLWGMVAIPWIVIARLVLRDLRGGPLDFLTQMTLCRTDIIPIALMILAALTQYGTHFYKFTHDRQWVRWKEAEHEYPA
jgi:hypothetical protein